MVELNRVSQFDIDRLIEIPKTLVISDINWRKKSPLAKDPAWLYIYLPVYDQEMLAISHFNIEMRYRPALEQNIPAKMSFVGIYKNTRIFGIDAGAGLIHHNRYWEDKSLRPQPIYAKVTGAHYHIHHEKYQMETGYPLEKCPDKVQNEFNFYLNEFLIRFHFQTTGEMPHPYQRINEDNLL
ncbi:hypothetical protein [Rodentibacter caecimuris]|uniref:Uncharacterized protein n=1 Tax=Rodentibacter caecimuris TaxID=1796644 RepID=A0ABX3KVW2_9PAST|nr:hypothetical protein BKG89_08160 [Rodentibacter heylii]